MHGLAHPKLKAVRWRSQKQGYQHPWFSDCYS